MGAGTLTMPYIVSKTGLLLGPVLILAGALLSYYAGMLIIKCSNITGKQSYEEFAFEAYGKRFSQAVSVCVLISLIGFATAYVALAKTLIPTALEATFGEEIFPFWLRNN
jgi:amino acid permease